MAIRLLCVMVNDGTVILKKEGENRRRLLRVLLLGNYTIVGLLFDCWVIVRLLGNCMVVG